MYCSVSNIFPIDCSRVRIKRSPPGDEGCFARPGVLSWCRDPLELQSRTNRRRSGPQTPSQMVWARHTTLISCTSSGTLPTRTTGNTESGK